MRLGGTAAAAPRPLGARLSAGEAGLAAAAGEGGLPLGDRPGAVRAEAGEPQDGRAGCDGLLDPGEVAGDAPPVVVRDLALGGDASPAARDVSRLGLRLGALPGALPGGERSVLDAERLGTRAGGGSSRLGGGLDSVATRGKTPGLRLGALGLGALVDWGDLLEGTVGSGATGLSASLLKLCAVLSTPVPRDMIFVASPGAEDSPLSRSWSKPWYLLGFFGLPVEREWMLSIVSSFPPERKLSDADTAESRA